MTKNINQQKRKEMYKNYEDYELIAMRICPDCYSRLLNIGGCLECRNEDCGFTVCD